MAMGGLPVGLLEYRTERWTVRQAQAKHADGLSADSRYQPGISIPIPA